MTVWQVACSFRAHLAHLASPLRVFASSAARTMLAPAARMAIPARALRIRECFMIVLVGVGLGAGILYHKAAFRSMNQSRGRRSDVQIRRGSIVAHLFGRLAARDGAGHGR